MMDTKEFRRSAHLMGSAFEFIIGAPIKDGERLLAESIAEVQRIEKLLTEFSETSETALINRSSGGDPVEVDEETFQLLKRSLGISRVTQGAFDITSGVLKKLYNFKGEKFIMPDQERINIALEKVGYLKIQLYPPNKVRLIKPGMHIAFGAIGKGYAADKVKKILVDKGVTDGVINASGDLSAWGTRQDGSSWKVAIANPIDKNNIIGWIPITNASVATSGDYEQFFMHNGKRYAHTIDPKTGLPVQGVKSVTVVSPSAELSDALATAVFTMGAEVGLHFVSQLPNTYALIVDDHNKVFTSKHINLNLNPK